MAEATWFLDCGQFFSLGIVESVESDCWFHVAKKIWRECRVPVEARMMSDVVVGGGGG